MQGPMIPPPASVLAAAAAARARESLEIENAAGNEDDGTVSDGKAQPSKSEKLKASAIHGVLVGGTVITIGAMAVSPAAAVFVMAAIFIGNVPYAAYKEIQLKKLPTLRQLNNNLREDANKIEVAVDALEQEIDELRPEAERAADVEGELKKIAGEQNKNTDTLVELVKENGRIQAEMQDNVRQKIVQDMLKLVMASDRNNDGTFSEKETGMLALRISMQLQEEGVEFDQEKFKRVMSKSPTMAQTIKIVKRLVPAVDGEEGTSADEVDAEDEEDFDMFHMKVDAVAEDEGAAPRARPSLGLARQPATRRVNRQQKIERLAPSAATTASRYSIV